MLDPATSAERALRMVRESAHLSYDTEGSGLDWRRNNPVGYVVGAPKTPGEIRGISQDDVVYVPIRHGGGGNLPGVAPMNHPSMEIEVHEFEKELARAFDDRNRTMGEQGLVIGHHIKFDCHFSANTGVMLGRHLSDTQDRMALVDEFTRSFSLSGCAETAGVEAKKGEDLYEHIAKMLGVPANRKAMEHFWKTCGTDPVVQEYACGDGVTTYQLWCWQERKIVEEEMQQVAKLEGDLIWTVFRMERAGVKVDSDRIEALGVAVERRIKQLMSEFPPDFNPRSPLKMKALMEEHGHTDWPLTEKGAPSFTEKWLKTKEVGRKVIEIRQGTNLINSFVKPLATEHMHEGRVHATFNQMKSDDKGTISGRFSCSSPNLQQVPKRNKEIAVPFRRLFVADPGTLFWERDYSQAEPRTFAEYSRDANLMGGYLQEPFVDCHQMVANLLQVERDPTAKRMNMGIFTGMQPPTFAAHMDWPLSKAAEAHAAWFKAFPGVKTFQDNAKLRFKRRGFVKTVLGRRCRLDHPRFAYRGTSRIIQGTDADIIKYKLLQGDKMCEEAGDIVRILVTVHDSFSGTRQDTEEAKELLADVIAVMEDVQSPPFNFKVPFILEGTEGMDWAEASFGVEKVQSVMTKLGW